MIQLPQKPFVYAIIDASMVGQRTLTEWVNVLAGDERAAVIQWRFKGLPDDQALAGAKELRAATRAAGVPFFINDRPDIARIVAADGVHVGQDDMIPADVRALLPHALVGVSTHTREQFEIAIKAPVDYVAVGPVFATASKANPDPVVGVSFVEWAATRTDKPIVGIGGITRANASDVIRAGASGISVISEFMKSADPARAAHDLRASLDSDAR